MEYNCIFCNLVCSVRWPLFSQIQYKLTYYRLRTEIKYLTGPKNIKTMGVVCSLFTLMINRLGSLIARWENKVFQRTDGAAV